MTLRREVRRTGIYRKTKYTADDPASIQEFLKMVADSSRTLSDLLHEIEADAEAVLKENALADANDAYEDAKWILNSVVAIRMMLKAAKLQSEQISAVNSSHQLAGDAAELENVVYEAIQLGVRTEILGIRPFEPHARSGGTAFFQR